MKSHEATNAKDLTPVRNEIALTTKEEAELRRVRNRDKERELVKGIFKDYECAKGTLEFVFKKYKEDTLTRYSFTDGGIYTIPLGVARHINTGCWYPIHSHTVDENGAKVQRVTEKVHRYGFSSLEFSDIDDFDRGGKQIIQVTNAVY